MKERIIQVIAYSGMSIMAFAKECDIKYYSLYSCITDRRSINVEILQKILEAFPEIEEGWLLLNRGEMLSQKTRAAIERRK